MPWTERAQVVNARRRFAPVDLAVETLDGFRRHQSGRNAAALAYWGFLSVFPLLLAATTILGFVLEDNPDLRDDIVDSALGQIPVVGSTIAANAGALEGNPWALVIGLVTAMWASLRGFVGLQAALDDVWDVHLDGRANLAVKRLRALLGVVVIGLAQVATVVLSGISAEADLPVVGRVVIVAGTVVINAAVVATMYRYLTSADVTWATIWPGAIPVGVAFTALQLFGTIVVSRMIANASEIYGTFASMLALLSWFSLHALVSLYGAELNAAIVRRRTRRRDLRGWLASGLDRTGLTQ
jgi:YihY family inner membrane protein